MEKIKYGPLVYITVEDTDEEGNFYWGGKPPIGYDELGIPIDSDGMQCLSVSSPLHPNYKPKNSVYNKNINDDLSVGFEKRKGYVGVTFEKKL